MRLSPITPAPAPLTEEQKLQRIKDAQKELLKLKERRAARARGGANRFLPPHDLIVLDGMMGLLPRDVWKVVGDFTTHRKFRESTEAEMIAEIDRRCLLIDSALKAEADRLTPKPEIKRACTHDEFAGGWLIANSPMMAAAIAGAVGVYALAMGEGGMTQVLLCWSLISFSAGMAALRMKFLKVAAIAGIAFTLLLWAASRTTITRTPPTVHVNGKYGDYWRRRPGEAMADNRANRTTAPVRIGMLAGWVAGGALLLWEIGSAAGREEKRKP